MLKIFATGLVIIFLFSSCKDDDYSPTYTYGEATAIVNGEVWRGEAELFSNNFGIGYDANCYIANSEGIGVKSFVFQRISTDLGIHSLYDTTSQLQEPLIGCMYYKTNEEGDIVTGFFGPSFDRDKNFIRVLSFDSTRKELTAEFEGIFIRGHKDPNHTVSTIDSIVVTNGVFTARIAD